MFCNRDACRACTVHNDFDVLKLLADELERVEQTRCNDDSSSVLVVVENRNIALFLELLFDLKASGSGDVLEVNAAKGAADEINCVDDFIDALASYANRESVNVAERLEQRAFSFHNGHACLGTDIAETENRGAVCNNGDKVVSSCQLVAFVIILLYFEAWLGNARGIGEGELLGIRYRNARDNLDFTVPVIMQFK